MVEFRADVHVTCRDGQVSLQNFIRAHEGRLVATKRGTVIADEQASGDITTYGWQLRAFAAAIAGDAPFSTTAAHAVGTMRVPSLFLSRFTSMPLSTPSLSRTST